MMNNGPMVIQLGTGFPLSFSTYDMSHIVISFLYFCVGDVANRCRTWSFFQDAHMMVVGGIGLLISYMKRYRYSGLGFNFLLAAVVYQWGVLFYGFAFGPKETEPNAIPQIEIQNGTMDYWKPSPYAFIKVRVP